MNEAFFSLGIVILAAGRSTRMGRPKLLLPWGLTSVLGHLLSQWRGVAAGQIVVVHATQDRDILAELDRLGVPAADRVANPDPDRGMFESIVRAARFPDWRASLTHWGIVLGDQPHLRLETLLRLVDFSRRHPRLVCQPMQNGKRGHPVVLPRSVFMDLAASKLASLKEFLAGREASGCECDDPGLELDIDRPEDYEKALALAGLKTE